MAEKPKRSLLWPIITIALVIGIAVILYFLFNMRSNLRGLLEEKETIRVELKQELDSLLAEHEAVKYEYGMLSDSLQSKDSIIQANAVEIKRLLNTQWEYYKVKKKLSRLQDIAQGYVRQMDSLYRVNETLTAENIEMKKDITELKKEKRQVEEAREILNEKVEIASVLQAYNIVGNGVRYRSGGSKEVETDKARKLEKIKVCFTLGANEIIEPGMKEVYIRIARPDKEILTKTKSDDYTFEYNGEMIQFSIKEEINYDNMSQEICSYWRKIYSSQDMPEGIYHIDIFCDGNSIGHSTFTLR
jgi:hypothetical protein